MLLQFFRINNGISGFVQTLNVCNRHFSRLHRNNEKNEILFKSIIACGSYMNPCDRRSFIGYVPDKKDGYKTLKEVSQTDHIKVGFRALKKEIKLWTEEWKERLRQDPQVLLPFSETDAVYEFIKQEDIDKFVVTSDSDHNEGYSHCTFKISEAGYGLFSGVLDSTVPREGKITKAGYCNITSLGVKKSFQRDSYYDWGPYNTLVLRIRGDGRPYSLNLHTPGIFDITWHDMYSYVLYTRGGPHWQLVKIPFSKFYLVAKGCIQDKQCYMSTVRVHRIGITAAGLNWMDGEFNLEIDYIGVEYNPYHTEETAYELYMVPNFVVGT